MAVRGSLRQPRRTADADAFIHRDTADGPDRPRAQGRARRYHWLQDVQTGGAGVSVSEDRVFDLMVDLVQFASARGLSRTALALEDALDAFLQDRDLVPRALPAPVGPAPAPVASGAAADPGRAGAAGSPAGGPVALPAVLPAVLPEVLAALAAPDPARAAAQGTEWDDPGAPAFHSRRPETRPRRLHLLPTQRVPG